MTTLDYQMPLPTGADLPDREYQGQRFCHHVNDQASWKSWQNTGLLKCQTSVLTDSAGIAAVNVFKAGNLIANENSHKAITVLHQDVLRFYYVMAGRSIISNEQGTNAELNVRDSFLLPAGQMCQISDVSEDFRCIEFVLKI